MNSFKEAQLSKIGVGGIKCKCCNKKARKGHGLKNNAINGVARAKVKAQSNQFVVEFIELDNDILNEMYFDAMYH